MESGSGSGSGGFCGAGGEASGEELGLGRGGERVEEEVCVFGGGVDDGWVYVGCGWGGEHDVCFLGGVGWGIDGALDGFGCVVVVRSTFSLAIYLPFFYRAVSHAEAIFNVLFVY